MKLTHSDFRHLHANGYIIMEAKNAPPLLLATVEYIQMLADAFAAGHSVNIAGHQIVGNKDHSQCPECVKEKS